MFLADIPGPEHLSQEKPHGKRLELEDGVLERGYYDTACFPGRKSCTQPGRAGANTNLHAPCIIQQKDDQPIDLNQK